MEHTTATVDGHLRQPPWRGRPGRRRGGRRSVIVGLVILSGLLASFGAAPLAAKTEPEFPHGDLQDECTLCHSPASWSPPRISESFDYAERGFALTGAHTSATCRACHVSLDFAEAATDCASCHQDEHRGELGIDCQRCHTTSSFTDRSHMMRAHRLTRFPLSGSHATASCESCHEPAQQGKLVFVNQPTECAACHLEDYNATTDPDHQAAGFTEDCSSCHTSTAWPQTTFGGGFDHAATGFPLEGTHGQLDCASCHVGGNFQGLNPDCAACHMNDYNATASPSHTAAGFPTDCASCHGTAAWLPATFDHDASAFPLSGAHRAVDCQSCHQSGVYTGLATDCEACHLQDRDAAIDPDHNAAGFLSGCAVCHNTGAWVPGTFDHNATAFPLTGLHQAERCASCHQSGVYAGLDPTCFSCHQPDYDATVAPAHAAAGFPTDCTACHATAGWLPASFDHNASAFPLTGAHQAVACDTCHQSGIYTGLATDCEACHLQDRDAAIDPDHNAAGFLSGCAVCHNTGAWVPGTYDHNATAFPLTGLHQAERCASCHQSGIYAGLDPTCFSCHQQDYDTTTTPNHVAAGFPTDCTACHATTGWLPAGFDHNASAFPLTGAHQAVACDSCHQSGVYAGLDGSCVSCHQQDYDATVAPAHAAAGFPTACATCHTTTAWIPGTFDHNATTFPLTGAHRVADCQSCHAAGVYAGLNQDCQSCHQQDYDTSLDPNHAAAGFPTTCVTCHATTAWIPSTFDHDGPYFPIYSGKHNGRWSACSDCHINPSNFTLFSCTTGCHHSDQSKVDNDHSEVNGYQYESQACFACHPRGES